ncbi:fasciclin domain-containing protein [Gloeothece verrucosa]|uniref:Beta-Ig-H3/fasciclin n=1 Tax=Gloeothece verrucosa (strain PCC 7822) TaxID=497965 RepID=E0UA96_GLOV7|nr:fasciclin domain-containing protein [Gloeothece verrucosa]ADN17401.1 beta-Ig-H3/fasciclin [Gloeothece verrucosa PCC 7822]
MFKVSNFAPLVTIVSLTAIGIGLASPATADQDLVGNSFPTPANSRPSAIKIAQTSRGNIVEVATAAGSFKTLTAALKAAGLEGTLSQEGPFTVFAPTDQAFAALPKGTVDNLLKPENKAKLVAILTYHVVPGKVTSSELKAGTVETVEGSPVMIKLGKKVQVNDATVIQPDIQASNGVIHVINKVILPPAK